MAQPQVAALMCVGCEDTIDTPAKTIDASHFCAGCVQGGIIPLFEKAIKSQAVKWPARYGRILLDARDYAEWLSEEFVQRYRRRTFEYKTKWCDRLYCTHKLLSETAPPLGGLAPSGEVLALTTEEIAHAQANKKKVEDCGAMIASRLGLSGLSSTDLRCYHCNGTACPKCGKPLQSPDVQGDEHKCSGKLPPLPSTAELGQRGIDYQVCPSCKFPVALLDGCNHMSCICGNEFCNLCGAEAVEDSGHWRAGMPCPRYGLAGAENAIFDGVPGDGDDDDEDADDDEDMEDAEVDPDEVFAHAGEWIVLQIQRYLELDDAFIDLVVHDLVSRGFHRDEARMTTMEAVNELESDLKRERDVDILIRHQIHRNLPLDAAFIDEAVDELVSQGMAADDARQQLAEVVAMYGPEWEQNRDTGDPVYTARVRADELRAFFYDPRFENLGSDAVAISRNLERNAALLGLDGFVQPRQNQAPWDAVTEFMANHAEMMVIILHRMPPEVFQRKLPLLGAAMGAYMVSLPDWVGLQ